MPDIALLAYRFVNFSFPQASRARIADHGDTGSGVTSVPRPCRLVSGRADGGLASQIWALFSSIFFFFFFATGQ